MEERQKVKKKKRVLSARLKIMIGFIFVLFVVLLLRLAYIQLYEGPSYDEEKTDISAAVSEFGP
ncbi:hypothetical protein [Bacillus massiliglaciei]|uniref:hypothetical protein n=1 Tax=Bacillus massiliglaciei TaxID=1816693 RepID=UPI000DA5EDA9|nr:hypothetical protein [Bacillus massiliglaciei]